MKLISADIKLLKEIIATPIDELIIDFKAYCEFRDWQWEEPLKSMITDYKKWANKSMGKPIRKQYLEIIKSLEKEMADVKCPDNPHRRRAVGFRIGRNNQENGNSRDTDNFASQTFPQPVRAKTGRLYRISWQTK